MTAKRRLIPESEIRSVAALARELGVEIGAIDVRIDGVTIYPKGEGQRKPFDAWKASQ